MIDTHAHLFIDDYNSNEEIKNVIQNMKNNIIIVSGTNLKNNKEVIELVNKYDNVYGTLGLHPTEIEDVIDIDREFQFIEKNLNHKKIVAIGEIGLDYHYEFDKEKQKEIFII